jgi:hypothetical protein
LRITISNLYKTKVSDPIIDQLSPPTPPQRRLIRSLAGSADINLGGCVAREPIPHLK